MVALLRAVRAQHGMTLDELATHTGLTKSYLSKVERGHSTPSVAAALKIARALDVDVARLFSDDAAAATITVERAANRPDSRNHPVAAEMLGKSMVPFVVRPGRQFASHPHPGHAGQEFLFVHEGEVELNHDGNIVTLTPGDCVYFDAALPHRLRRISAEPATVIVVAHDPPSTRALPKRRDASR